MIVAAMIDSREPSWVQSLTFGGIPTVVQQLDAGDVHAVTDDGCVLMIERKTPDDFLNSLQDERLFPQLTRLVENRLDEQAVQGKLTTWPYLMITGQFERDSHGKIVTPGRQTNWSWDAIQGALLTIQEMGVFVVQCGSDMDFEAAIMRLGKRSRDPEFKLLPPRVPNILGAGAAILASLPG
jgi:ERCC4-type nuclease